MVRDAIIRMAGGGLGAEAIARALQDVGVPTRHGRPWHPATIEGIVARARLTGPLPEPEPLTPALKARFQPMIEEVGDRIASITEGMSATARRKLMADLYAAVVASIAAGYLRGAERDGPQVDDSVRS
jgi:hypothetical protein